MFEEPDSIGGVPIIKYRVAWHLPSQDWTSRDYNAEEGESHTSVDHDDPVSSAYLLPAMRCQLARPPNFQSQFVTIQFKDI